MLLHAGFQAAQEVLRSDSGTHRPACCSRTYNRSSGWGGSHWFTAAARQPTMVHSVLVCGRSASATSRGQLKHHVDAADGFEEPEALPSSWPLRRRTARKAAGPATTGRLSVSAVPAKAKARARLRVRRRDRRRPPPDTTQARRRGARQPTLAGVVGRSAASAPGKRRRLQQEQALADRVGPITESQEDHVRRHRSPSGTPMLSCPRCRWYYFGHKWVAAYGCFARQGTRSREQVVWLSERPERWQGTWGLGCAICAGFLHRQRRDSPGSGRRRPCLDAGPPSGSAAASASSSSLAVPRASRRRLGTAWARYDVRASTLQASQVRQHALSDLHKRAVESFLCPDVPARIALQATESDDRLLAGAVPQPADWLRTWRAVRSPKSWQAAAAEAETEHFIHQIRHRAVTPRSMQAMVEVMREVVRQQKREWIRACSSIFIAVDDRQSRKLVKFKCDMPALAATQGQSPQWAREGILGCIESVHGKSFREFDDDYARGVGADILRMVSAFATPLGGAEDSELVSHVKLAVRGFVADKALQKVGHVLKTEAMKNIVVLCRDPCHMIRIACKDPLQTTGSFEAQHERLFGKHGLFKDRTHQRVIDPGFGNRPPKHWHGGASAMSLRVAVSLLSPCREQRGADSYGE